MDQLTNISQKVKNGQEQILDPHPGQRYTCVRLTLLALECYVFHNTGNFSSCKLRLKRCCHTRLTHSNTTSTTLGLMLLRPANRFLGGFDFASSSHGQQKWSEGWRYQCCWLVYNQSGQCEGTDQIHWWHCSAHWLCQCPHPWYDC